MDQRLKQVGTTFASGLLASAMWRRGLTRADLARASGVSRSLVNAYVDGTREPSMSQLARVLGSIDLELRVGIEERDEHDAVLAADDAALPGETRTAEEILESYSRGRSEGRREALAGLGRSR